MFWINSSSRGRLHPDRNPLSSAALFAFNGIRFDRYADQSALREAAEPKLLQPW